MRHDNCSNGGKLPTLQRGIHGVALVTKMCENKIIKIELEREVETLLTVIPPHICIIHSLYKVVVSGGKL